MDRETIWTSFRRALLVTYTGSTLHLHLKHAASLILLLRKSRLIRCPLLDHHLVVRLGETSRCLLLHEHGACALVVGATVELTWHSRAIGA